MLFKLQPIIYSLIFATALEIVDYKQEWFFQIAIFLVIFSILVVWPLARKLRFLAIPFFLSLGSLSLLYLIDLRIEKHAFIILSALVYYLALLGAYRLKIYDCDQTAQGMVNLATVATIFFWYVSNYGWFLNFEIQTWFLVLAFVGSTFFISLPSLRICASMQIKRRKEAEKCAIVNQTQAIEAQVEIITEDKFKVSKRKGIKNWFRKSSQEETPVQKESEKIPTYMLINNWVIVFLNFILSLIMAQVIWGLSLWPFGHLTTGVTALIIYFVFWDLIRNFVQGTFIKKSVITNMVLAALSIMGILLTTRWEMAVR